MAAIGIDLGSELSIVAALMKSNKPGASQKGRQVCILSNEAGDLTTPTWVSFKGEQFFAGNDVTDNMRIMNAKNTISDFKSLLGKKFQDPDVQELKAFAPYQIIEMPDGSAGVRVQFRDEESDFSIPSLMGMYLSKLKEISLTHIENSRDLSRPLDAVISCPGYFTNEQRQALLDAAKIGGLHVLRLMSDIAAIAYEWGFPRLTLPTDTPTYVMFFVMGHSNTTVGIVEFKKNNFRVVAQASEMFGGRTIDMILVRHFARLFEEKHRGLEGPVLQNARYRMRLLVASQKCKKLLSAGPLANFTVENLYDHDMSMPVKRTEIEALIAPLMPRIEALARRVVQEAGLTDVSQISSLEVVGGSTRIPLVKQTIEKFFGRPLSTTLNSEECIPRGCTLQAVQLSPFFTGREITMVDTYPYTVRVTWPPIPGEENFLDVFQRHGKLPQTPEPISKLLTFRRKEPFYLTAEYSDPTLPPGTTPQITRIDVNEVPGRR